MEGREVFYQIWIPGDTEFESSEGAYATRKEAIPALRKSRRNFPDAFLAKVTYERIEPSKKGR